MEGEKRGIYTPDEVGIFVAQYLGQPGCEDLMATARTMAGIGYKQLQLTPDCFDLAAAAASQGWCVDNLIGPLGELGLRVSEVSFHIPGQLMAVHPAYAAQYRGFLPAALQPGATLQTMYEWGVEQTKRVIDASVNLGINAAVGFTGSLGWPYMYPWPQRPGGLVAELFRELAARWAPIVEYAHDRNVLLAFELHPDEDVHDGTTFERFHDALTKQGLSPSVVDDVGINYDPSHLVLQQLDYLEFLSTYLNWIYAYHVKDAVFEPNGKQGVYGGYAPWSERAGRFCTPGTGQVDFAAIEEILAWTNPAVVEWEDPRQDALQGARWANQYLTTGTVPYEDVIEPAAAFDDFAQTDVDVAALLGLDQYRVSSLQ